MKRMLVFSALLLISLGVATEQTFASKFPSSQNSRLGFELPKTIPHEAPTQLNPNLASGIAPRLRPNDVGSRCSGKERDQESGLDYFGARYFSGAQGRFLSSDEGPPREEDPQSLNRYSYVRNNPLRYIDEDGDYWVEASSKYTRFKVFRETSWVAAELTSKSWGKYIDYASRKQRGDTNQPGLIPFRGFTFDHDEIVHRFDDPERYSLREGIQLDQRAFFCVLEGIQSRRTDPPQCQYGVPDTE